ncbi:transcription factor SPT20 homolog [Haliotis rufescens]|uniref:transcription factor SPT20 homolog n=1 Tax=Haliotis rufescens TaxID=6454 RepID=UPI00201F73E2|nr:transcription factor SPT20 homolog [Haliotis rufescens]
MTASIQRAAQYAEYLLQCSRQHPASLLPSPPSTSSKGKSLHQKLVDLYIEECNKHPEVKELDHATHLLGKLVRRDKLNCLVLNLYPANEGYSLMLKARNGVESETIKLPYEESELLEYVDAAQLPPFLVDLLEKAQVNVFYNGCVIVEVRDFRRSTTGSHDTQYVMLKPTPQSLLCDINALTNDGNRWTQDDVFQLERQLLMATEEPICLDPSPAVLLINNRLQFEHKKLNNPMLKRCVKKFTQAAVNRKRKLEQAPAPPELKLHDFIHKRKDKSRANPPVNLKVGKSCVDMWKQRPTQLSAPESVNVEELAKVQKPPASGKHLVLIEEHTLERDPNQERHMLAKITIYQQPCNDCYIGELYLDYDYCNDKISDGHSCQFTLGSKESVDKYFEQFKELFTEEGRRSVKITTQRPNQPASVMYTQTTQSPSATSITITNAQALLKHATSMAATITTQNEPTGSAGLAAKRNMPIQLSLSLGPPGSGSINAAANILSPQSGVTGTTSSQQLTNQTPLPAQQLTLSQGNQSHSSTQRIKPFSISHSRVTSTPSPVSTPTATTTAQHQFIASASSVQTTGQKIPTPAATPTPPPVSRTPTPTSSASRRTSTTESVTIGQTTQNLPQATNLTTYLQGLTSSGALTVTSAGESGSITQQPNLTTNINITNLGGLPQNFNISSLAGLQGMNIANLQGLSNVQVSLTGVSMPGGGIAVPVPITMINNNSSLLQNQGILVSSLPNMAASVTSSSTDSAAASVSQSSNQSTSVVTSPHSFVTMVTALPSTTASATTATSTSVSSTVVMSTGLGSNPNTVLPSQSTGMLSLPFGLAGNLTQLVPVGAGKTTSAGSGLRAQPAAASATTASLPLLQLQGQQGIQLLNLQQQHRGGQVKPGQSSGGPTQTSARAVTTTVPISTVLTQTLTSQQMAALSTLTLGKPGQTTTTSFTPQQLMQLTGQTHLQQSQLQPQLTFQKTQSSAAQPHLQFHQLQLKQPTSSPAPPSASHSKSKSKKRTTPTPPKL